MVETIFIWLIFFTIIVGLYAQKKNRSPMKWMIISLFISPILTFIILLFMKTLETPEVQNWWELGKPKLNEQKLGVSKPSGSNFYPTFKNDIKNLIIVGVILVVVGAALAIASKMPASTVDNSKPFFEKNINQSIVGKKFVLTLQKIGGVNGKEEFEGFCEAFGECGKIFRFNLTVKNLTGDVKDFSPAVCRLVSDKNVQYDPVGTRISVSVMPNSEANAVAYFSYFETSTITLYCLDNRLGDLNIFLPNIWS